MATSTTYNRAFWNVMKGKDENYQNLNEGYDNVGAYVAPDEFREGFNTAGIQSLKVPIHLHSFW